MIHSHATRGFTLVELLVTVAIIAALVGIGVPAMGKAMQASRRTAEQAAARNLGQAQHLYTTDHNQRVLVGYARTATAKDQSGRVIGPPASQRYPWRLAPYAQHQLKGTFLVNSQAALADAAPAGDSAEWALWAYRVSLYPSLGYNSYYVGGHENESTGQVHPKYKAIRNLTQAVAPSRLMTFVSARSDVGEPQDGYFYVAPPTLADYDPAANPQNYGYVAPRWNGEAVAVHLDGHVDLLDYASLRDMTRWSNEAARQHNPDWKPR